MPDGWDQAEAAGVSAPADGWDQAEAVGEQMASAIASGQAADYSTGGELAAMLGRGIMGVAKVPVNTLAGLFGAVGAAEQFAADPFGDRLGAARAKLDAEARAIEARIRARQDASPRAASTPQFSPLPDVHATNPLERLAFDLQGMPTPGPAPTDEEDAADRRRLAEILGLMRNMRSGPTSPVARVAEEIGAIPSQMQTDIDTLLPPPVEQVTGQRGTFHPMNVAGAVLENATQLAAQLVMAALSPGNRAMAFAASGAPFQFSGAIEQHRDLRKKQGMNDQQAIEAAALPAIIDTSVNTVLERLSGEGLFGGGAVTEPVRRTVRQKVIDLLARGAKGFASEGATETAQEQVSAAIEAGSGADPTALDPENLLPRLAMSGLVGGILGGGAGVAMGAFDQVQSRRESGKGQRGHAGQKPTTPEKEQFDGRQETGRRQQEQGRQEVQGRQEEQGLLTQDGATGAGASTTPAPASAASPWDEKINAAYAAVHDYAVQNGALPPSREEFVADAAQTFRGMFPDLSDSDVAAMVARAQQGLGDETGQAPSGEAVPAVDSAGGAGAGAATAAAIPGVQSAVRGTNAPVAAPSGTSRTAPDGVPARNAQLSPSVAAVDQVKGLPVVPDRVAGQPKDADGLDRAPVGVLIDLARRNGVDPGQSRAGMVAGLRRKGVAVPSARAGRVEGDAKGATPPLKGVQAQGVPGAQGTVQNTVPQAAQTAPQGSVGVGNTAAQGAPPANRNPELRARFDAVSEAHARFASRADALVADGTWTPTTADAVLAMVEAWGTKPEYLERVQLVSEKITKGKDIQAPGKASDAFGGGVRRDKTEVARLSLMQGLETKLREKGMQGQFDLQPLTVFMEEWGHIAGELVLNKAQKNRLRREYASRTPQEWSAWFRQHGWDQSAADYAAGVSDNGREMSPAEGFHEWLAHTFIQHSLGTDTGTSAEVGPLLDRVLAAFKAALQKIREVMGGVPDELKPLFDAMQMGDVQPDTDVPAARPKPAPKAPNVPQASGVRQGSIGDIEPQTRSAQHNAISEKVTDAPQKGSAEKTSVATSAPTPPADRPAPIQRAERPVIEPPPMTRVVDGRAGILRTADNREYPVTYKLVEADEITPTHDARIGFRRNEAGDPNERPYDDPRQAEASRAKVRNIADAPKPDLLYSDTTSPTDGPPIADSKGRILGGNARSMGLQLAYADGLSSAREYRQAAKDAAPKFGIDPARVDEFKEPVIVRMLRPEDSGDPGSMSRILNDSFTAPKSVLTDARSRASKLDANATNRIIAIIGDYDTLGEALANETVASRVIQEMARVGAWSADDNTKLLNAENGKLLEDGRLVIERALLGSIIPDIGTLAELTPGVRQSLTKALPGLIQVKEAFDRPDSDVDWNRTIIGAIKTIKRAGNEPILEAAYGQMPFGGADPIQELTGFPSTDIGAHRAIALAHQLKRQGPREFAESVARAAVAIREAANGQTNMMMGRAPSPGEAFDAEMGTRAMFGRGLWDQEDGRPRLLELRGSRDADGNARYQMVESDTGQPVSRFYTDRDIALREMEVYNKARIAAAKKGDKVWRDTSQFSQEFNEAEKKRTREFDRDKETGSLFGRALDIGNQDELGFYSRLERWVVEKMRGPMHPDQLRKALANSGLPLDEIKWTGVDAWLADQKRPVKPEAVKAWLGENRVVLKEVVKGGSSDSQRVAEAVRRRDAAQQKVGRLLSRFDARDTALANFEDSARFYNSGGPAEISDDEAFYKAVQPYSEDIQNKMRKAGLFDAFVELRSAWRESEAAQRAEPRSERTQFETYTLPGGENYREVLLTLPSAPVLPDGWTIEELPDGRAKLTSPQGPIGTWPDRESALQSQAKQGPAFVSSHFSEPNIIAHMRIKDRVTPDGRRVLFLEEVQSDWGESLRDHGGLRVRNLREPRSLRKEFQDFFGAEPPAQLPLTPMDGSVLSALQNDEIRRAVVLAIPVEVMDMLGPREAATKQFLRDPSVLIKSLPAADRDAALQGIWRAAGETAARIRAELLGALEARRNINLLPALRASDLTPAELVGILAPNALYHLDLPKDSIGADVAAVRAKEAVASRQFGVGNLKSLPATDAVFLDTALPASGRAEADAGESRSLDRKRGPARIAEALKWHSDLRGRGEQYAGHDVPSMPFHANWHEMVLRRAIRLAAQGGYDAIGWTTGKTQTQRYEGLAQQIDRVRWTATRAGGDDATTRTVSLYTDRARVGDFVVDIADGTITLTNGPHSAIDEMKGKHLREVVGADLAKEILGSPEAGEKRGTDITIGGEGMRNFYDRDLPNYARKYGKRWGVQPESGKVNTDIRTERGQDYDDASQPLPATTADAHLLPVNAEMIYSVTEEGQPLFGRAFHGSPHTFDKFSTEKIGTGEGAQSFGYGLYFAGNKEVAEHYQSKLALPRVFFDGQEVKAWKRDRGVLAGMKDDGLQRLADEGKITETERRAIASISADQSVDSAIKNLHAQGDMAWRSEAARREWHELADTLERLKPRIRVEQTGRMYEVELAPQEDEYLLWDRPFSEQSEKVKAALRKDFERLFAPGKPVPGWGDLNGPQDGIATGERIYARIASDKGGERMMGDGGKQWGPVKYPDERAASQHLHSLGIRGIKYLDGSSRNQRAKFEFASADAQEKAKAEFGNADLWSGKKWADVTLDNNDGDMDKTVAELKDREARGIGAGGPTVALKLIESGAIKQVFPHYNYVIFSDDDVEIKARYGRSLFDRGDEEATGSSTGDLFAGKGPGEMVRGAKPGERPANVQRTSSERPAGGFSLSGGGAGTGSVFDAEKPESTMPKPGKKDEAEFERFLAGLRANNEARDKAVRDRLGPDGGEVPLRGGSLIISRNPDSATKDKYPWRVTRMGKDGSGKTIPVGHDVAKVLDDPEERGAYPPGAVQVAAQYLAGEDDPTRAKPADMPQAPPETAGDRAGAKTHPSRALSDPDSPEVPASDHAYLMGQGDAMDGLSPEPPREDVRGDYMEGYEDGTLQRFVGIAKERPLGADELHQFRQMLDPRDRAILTVTNTQGETEALLKLSATGGSDFDIIQAIKQSWGGMTGFHGDAVSAEVRGKKLTINAPKKDGKPEVLTQRQVVAELRRIFGIGKSGDQAKADETATKQDTPAEAAKKLKARGEPMVLRAGRWQVEQHPTLTVPQVLPVGTRVRVGDMAMESGEVRLSTPDFIVRKVIPNYGGDTAYPKGTYHVTLERQPFPGEGTDPSDHYHNVVVDVNGRLVDPLMPTPGSTGWSMGMTVIDPKAPSDERYAGATMFDAGKEPEGSTARPGDQLGLLGDRFTVPAKGSQASMWDVRPTVESELARSEREAADNRARASEQDRETSPLFDTPAQAATVRDALDEVKAADIPEEQKADLTERVIENADTPEVVEKIVADTQAEVQKAAALDPESMPSIEEVREAEKHTTKRGNRGWFTEGFPDPRRTQTEAIARHLTRMRAHAAIARGYEPGRFYTVTPSDVDRTREEASRKPAPGSLSGENSVGQRRAGPGGEVGPNGEFYPAGSFINTVPENPKGENPAPSGPRTDATVRDSGKPWDGASVDDESKWFGTRVRVAPELRGETEIGGTVQRVLNGGRLVEVKPDGVDTTFRYDSDRVSVEPPVKRWQPEDAQKIARAIGHPNNQQIIGDIRDAIEGKGPWSLMGFLSRQVGFKEAEEALAKVREELDSATAKPASDAPKADSDVSRRNDATAEPDIIGSMIARADEWDAIIAKAKLKVEKSSYRGRPTYAITGDTYPVRELIKNLVEDRRDRAWDGDGKKWHFFADPTSKLATALSKRGVGPDATRPATGRDGDEDVALKAARERELNRADERPTGDDAAGAVQRTTADLIRLGSKAGIPDSVLDSQIEDIGMIRKAYEADKPTFIVGSAPGSGKTYVIAGTIRELRDAGAKKFMWVTMNQTLIEQIKNDVGAYGLEGVRFATYSQLSGNTSEEVTDSDGNVVEQDEPTGETGPLDTTDTVLILDEAHNVKNETKRGKAAATMIEQADFTVFSSATPFENPVQAKYLEPTGIFRSVGGHTQWAILFGAHAKTIKVAAEWGSPGSRFGKKEVTIAEWRGGKEAAKLARGAKRWLEKQGMLSQRPLVLPPGMVKASFEKYAADEKFVDLYNKVQSAYDMAEREWKDDAGNSRDPKTSAIIAMHRVNATKRILEAAKTESVIKRAKELQAEGKKVVIFVETKADRELGRFRESRKTKGERYSYPKIAQMMEEWRAERSAMRAAGDYGGPPAPFSEGIVSIAKNMWEMGLDDASLPSVTDDIMRAIPDAHLFTGEVSDQEARRNLAAWRKTKTGVILATMAKGGTGLSLHDKIGEFPTAMLVLNMPWTATQLEQVSGRINRYGLASIAENYLLFADNIPFEQQLARRIGGRMRSMNATVKGIGSKAADALEAFDFESGFGAQHMLLASEQAKHDEKDAPAERDIDTFEQAEAMDKTRNQAPDKEMDFFATPYVLSALMAKAAAPRGRVLEPSAGEGNLLRFLPEGAKVDALEPHVHRGNVARGAADAANLAAVIHNSRFEDWQAPEGGYDAVIMNPPFSRVKGEGWQDITHVRRAFDMLAPDGRLVAVMSEGPFFRDDKQSRDFRYWIEDHGATVIRLPEGAFKDSGTSVRARIIIVDKKPGGGSGVMTLESLDAAEVREMSGAIPIRDGEAPRFGRSIESSETRQKWFQQWFKGSKIVNEDGSPKVMYHGTPTPGFEAFDPERINQLSRYGPGFYFTSNHWLAHDYATDTDRRGAVGVAAPAIMPVYLRMTNPVDLRTDDGARDFLREVAAVLEEGDSQDRALARRIRTYMAPDSPMAALVATTNPADVVRRSLTGPRIGALAQQLGHDGVILHDTQGADTSEVAIAFDPKQIKSVNAQRFDPDDDRLVFGRGIPDDDMNEPEADEVSDAERRFNELLAEPRNPPPRSVRGQTMLARAADRVAHAWEAGTQVSGFLGRTATGFIEKMGGAGKRIASEIREVVGKADERAGTAIDDVQRALHGFSAADRRLVALYMNGRRDDVLVGITPRIKEAAEAVRDILDRDMKDAADAGVERKLRSGKRIPLGGVGKAYPHHLNDMGREWLALARERDGSDPQTQTWAEGEVAAGRARTPGEAIRRLLAWDDARLRGVNPYFEMQRVMMPEWAIEWDPAVTLPAHFHRSAMFVEGVREWGTQFERMYEQLGSLVKDQGPWIGAMVGDYFRAHYGGKSKEPHALKVTLGALSNMETVTRLGISPLSMLQNMGQRFSGTIRHGPGVAIDTLRRYPPFVNGMFKASRALEHSARRAGALSKVSELVTPEAGAPLARVADVVMGPFQSVETGNQTTAAVMAAIGLRRDIDRLLKQAPVDSRIGKLAEGLLSLTGFRDPRSAAYRRVIRSGMSAERLVSILSGEEKVSDDDLRRAMRAMVYQTQFPLNMASEPIWYRAWWGSPIMRLALKFKQYGFRQAGFIWRDVLEEAFKHGNAGPLVRFIVAMLITGELYSLARDLLLDRDDSITRLYFSGRKADAQEWAARVATSFARGGGLGFVADLTYGILPFFTGPFGSTVGNVIEQGRNAINPVPGVGQGGPSQLIPAARKLVEGQVAAVRQAQGLYGAVERQFSEKAKRAKEYRHAREAARDFKPPTAAGVVADDLDTMLYGRDPFRPGPFTLPMASAARCLDFGDTDGASAYIRACLKSRKGESERKQALATIRRMLASHSPLGPVSDKHLPAFLQQYERADAIRLRRMDDAWKSEAEAALRKAALDAR